MISSKSRRWRILALVLRVALGAIFIYAAWTKLRDPWQMFALSIDSYRLLPMWAVRFVARTLPWLEMALGVLVVAGVWLRFSATAVSVLLLGFFGLLVRAWILHMEISCGCFGPGEVVSWRTLLRDGSMLAGSLLLTAMSLARPRKPA
jgi:putative oxidoreductase